MQIDPTIPSAKCSHIMSQPIYIYSTPYCKTLIIHVSLFSRDHHLGYINETLLSRSIIFCFIISSLEILGEDFIFVSPCSRQFTRKIKSSRIKSVLQYSHLSKLRNLVGSEYHLSFSATYLVRDGNGLTPDHTNWRNTSSISVWFLQATAQNIMCLWNTHALNDYSLKERLIF